MQTLQLRWTPEKGWTNGTARFSDADLVLLFSDVGHFQEAACYDELHAMFPKANIVGCSSSGSVMDTTISDNDIVATAICLENGTVKVETADVSDGADVLAVSRGLMDKLHAADIRHAFVLSDGLFINGSELASGLNSAGIAVTGGLAGDVGSPGTELEFAL